LELVTKRKDGIPIVNRIETTATVMIISTKVKPDGLLNFISAASDRDAY
jgi:hypothetical protein